MSLLPLHPLLLPRTRTTTITEKEAVDEETLRIETGMIIIVQTATTRVSPSPTELLRQPRVRLHMTLPSRMTRRTHRRPTNRGRNTRLNKATTTRTTNPTTSSHPSPRSNNSSSQRREAEVDVSLGKDRACATISAFIFLVCSNDQVYPHNHSHIVTIEATLQIGCRSVHYCIVLSTTTLHYRTDCSNGRIQRG
ncbi:hypothetical protein BKA57DRAFT_444117 [Linnemannia elongata]|nr:hypothetical protein BKA57DRAFT_444117 [Linnemannia elongata]